MIKKIEHIGIAVDDLAEASQCFENLLSQTRSKIEQVSSEHVNTAFFEIGETKLELLEPSSEESTITTFLQKRKGMHHLALQVTGIHEEILRLKGLGFEFINEHPKEGADGVLFVFLHPRSTAGVLVELCEHIS